MRLLRIPALFLAALLQMLPLCRTVCTSPAVTSTVAIIFRWGVGATAALGAFDAVSGASVYYTSPSSATGHVGTHFEFHATIANTGSDLGAQFAAVPLPPGLVATVHDDPPNNVYGILSGTPTQPTNNMSILFAFSGKPGWGTAITNFHLTILPAATLEITNQPLGSTNVAGSTVSFSVGVSSDSPPGYQWRLNGGNLADKTNHLLILNNVRTNQSGDYTVVITGSNGSLTSAPARLMVTVPPSPTISFHPIASGDFQFSFVPVIGLTNTVLTNSTLLSSGWSVLTNVPPPTDANPVTISDPISTGTKFYRVVFDP